MRPILPANVIDLDRALADHEATLHSQAEALRIVRLGPCRSGMTVSLVQSSDWQFTADERRTTAAIVVTSIAFLLGLGLGVLLST